MSLNRKCVSGWLAGSGMGVLVMLWVCSEIDCSTKLPLVTMIGMLLILSAAWMWRRRGG